MENEEVKTESAEVKTNHQETTNGVNSGSITAESEQKSEPKKERSKESGRPRRRSRERSRSSRRRSRSPARPRDERTKKRVYVANIPFDVKWGELKDLFREKVGNVRFCQMFENEEGKPRGCGLVEMEDSASAKKAIEVLNRYEIRGRELVVKEDLDIERDRYGRLILPSSRKESRDRDRHQDRDHRDHDRYPRYDDHYRNNSDSISNDSCNTYGLSPQFLSSLGIKGPLNNRVFVANLDYKVNERKLEEIFKLAGKVTRVRLYLDNDGKSKGYGVVEFEHPVEAVQAISMFNNQKLYDRILSVRLDKFDIEDPFANEAVSKLPGGLEGIGKGLGIGGQPLNINKNMLNQGQIGGVQSGVTPSVVAPSVAPQAASAALTALTNLANLPNLAQSLVQLTGSAGPIANQSIAPSGYSSSVNEIAPAPTPGASAYAGYQAIPPVNPTPQPYVANHQMAPTGGYGHSSGVNAVAPYAASAPTATAPINSYSTYDQRRGDIYQEDKYRASNQSDTIYVRNLPSNFNWQSLRDRFNEIGNVCYCEAKPNGIALVRFSTPKEAQRACALMNGIRIENRPIDVDLYY